MAEEQKKDLTQVVAQHYNKLEESGLAERVKSRIFYLRNFNNWIKSQIIGKTIQQIRNEKGSESKICVLDLGSGKGGDLLKWRKGKIHHLVCADIAGTSVEQCESRYKEMVDRASKERYPQAMFSAEFITADCTQERLKEKYKNPATRFDLVSCQFSFHYSFESYDQANMMLRNACECLKPGGFFIGTTPNAYEIVKRLRKTEGMCFRNEVFGVSYLGADKENIPLFGAKYDFHLEGVVDCPEFVTYIPAMEKLAEQYGMKLVSSKPFAEYFSEQVAENDGRGLIGRMQALEPYPAEGDVDLMCKDEDAYTRAKAKLAEIIVENEETSSRGYKKAPKVGTLSKDEWEAATIYLVFAFQKVADVSPENPPVRKAEPVVSDAEAEPQTTAAKGESLAALDREPGGENEQARAPKRKLDGEEAEDL